MPAVSIIVPVYNVEKYLDECLTSIEAQSLHDLEIIVVNDGSTDSSPEIIKQHACRDNRIRVIDKPNGGYGHTINRGLEAATGDYVGIVESDDFVEPTMFETLYERATRDDLDIARVNYWYYWSKPEPRNEFFEAYFKDVCDRVFNPRDLVQCFYFPPALWAMLVRRSMIEDHGLRLLETPGASFQDTAFSFKLWSCANRAELIHEPYLHYRQDNEGSSINNRKKVYYVCEEYTEAERFAREDIKDTSLLPIVNRRRFDAYLWNLQRIDDSLRMEFAERGSREFAHALAEKEVDRSQFTAAEWNRLQLWAGSAKQLLSDLDREQHSLAFKLKSRLRKLMKRG
ncbi:glycosyltransferase [Collinsella sp. An2]|uniref:glycosyltransferase n=1 Tax=Collinsella sp. An2 TaxID=1965585 RepID=UPI000B372E6E|nr:glycosyltransferase [Collinsella sp. An2]OUP10067.1 hypothetical protein B5F33_03140 [Collinsella sp. An2]